MFRTSGTSLGAPGGGGGGGGRSRGAQVTGRVGPTGGRPCRGADGGRQPPATGHSRNCSGRKASSSSSSTSLARAALRVSEWGTLTLANVAAPAPQVGARHCSRGGGEGARRTHHVSCCPSEHRQPASQHTQPARVALGGARGRGHSAGAEVALLGGMLPPPNPPTPNRHAPPPPLPAHPPSPHRPEGSVEKIATGMARSLVGRLGGLRAIT